MSLSSRELCFQDSALFYLKLGTDGSRLHSGAFEMHFKTKA